MGGHLDPFEFGLALGRSSKPNLMLGVALHEALLNGWPFTYLADRQPVTVVYGAAEALGISPQALQAVMDVERTPFPPGVVMLIDADDGFEWPEIDIRQLIQDMMAEMQRPRTMEEMKSSWDIYDRKLGEAYKLQSAHYALDEKVFVSTPLPDKHRYGPHATDPYAPGNRRRRR